MRIGLIGFGYWGEKWARVLAHQNLLAWISDPNPKRVEAAKDQYPATPVSLATPWIYDGTRTGGVIIATPPPTHAQLIDTALALGVHVLVEKPLTTSSQQARKLILTARNRQLTLLPGHTFLYSEPVWQMFAWLQDMGFVRHIRMEWLNRGIVRENEDVLWSVGPHPFSILHSIKKKNPSQWNVFGASYFQEDRVDVFSARVAYDDGTSGEVSLSWLDPQKTRRITVLCEHGEIVCEPTIGIVERWYKGEHEVSERRGVEPLSLELADFVGAAEDGRKLMVSSFDGLRVVETLEHCTHLLQQRTSIVPENKEAEHGTG